jgi:hypothetical protein
MIDSGMISEHALEMAPRTWLIAQVMLRAADHSLADQSIADVGPVRSQSMESLRQCQSNGIPTPDDVKNPQAIERSQLVLGVIETLGYVKRPCPGRAGLVGSLASGVAQGRAQGGVELHFLARVLAQSGSKTGQRLFGTAATFVQ